MATNFPGSLDSFTNPTSGSTLDSPSHAAQHANINDAMEAVQAKLGVGAGTIGTWTSYTPTLTNWAVNSITAKYCQINKFVAVHFTADVSSVSGTMQMSLPVTASSSVSPNGHQIWMLDQGSAYFQGSLLANTSAVSFYAYYTGATYASWGPTSASVPFTWVNNDAVFGAFHYEAA